MTTTDTRTVPAPGRHQIRPTAGASAPLTSAVTRSIVRTGRVVLDGVESTARRAAVPTVRIAMAVVFLWFGLPKAVPGASPAEGLAVRTVGALTGGLLHGDGARLLVAGLEIALGLALLLGRCMPLVLLVLLGHLCGTTAPLVLFPEETWRSPGVGTLEGQYIIKNVVLVAGIVVLAGWGMRPRP